MKKIISNEDGTSFSYDFYFEYETFSNMYDVNSEIYKLKDTISSAKERLFGLSVSTPILKDGDSVMDIISDYQLAIKEEFEWIEENHYKLFKLKLLKELMKDEINSK